MKAAIISDGVVQNIVVIDPSDGWQPSSGALVPIEDDSPVSSGWLWDGLAFFGPDPPPITAYKVRAEAQRRIMALVGAIDLNGCIIKQLNAIMRANELNDIRHDREWTTEEVGEAAALRGMADQIKAIRAASNVLEPNPPSDFTADTHWP